MSLILFFGVIQEIQWAKHFGFGPVNRVRTRMILVSDKLGFASTQSFNVPVVNSIRRALRANTEHGHQARTSSTNIEHE